MRLRLQGTKIKAKRQPFWLPASSFYFLITGFAAASFFLVIGFLHDDGSEPEIVVAGLVASGVLISGVVLREVVLRNAREKYILERNKLDSNIKSAFPSFDRKEPSKFTLEKNTAAIESIRTRSEAAKIFNRISQGHREVFELCAEYRRIVAKEITNIHPNSPRLKALIKGNEFALETHKFHLLKWAELESKSLANTAQTSDGSAARTAFAERAKQPLLLALDHYPDEAALKESIDLLDELIVSMRLSELVEKADDANARGEKDRAREAYHEALLYLEHNTIPERYNEVRVHLEKALRVVDED